MLSAVKVLVACFQAGGKVLLCGNGGSAADAQHLAAEFVGRLSGERERRALPALALSSNTSSLTALGNDYGFAQIFVRQVEALGRAGDVLIGISTSGDSQNVVEAVRLAKGKGLTTIGLLGKGGGQLRALVDIAIVVPGSNTPRIQEGHIAVGHFLCDLVEQVLFPEE
jgi:D-sedoheptulose 7-phosphate isomerase